MNVPDEMLHERNRQIKAEGYTIGHDDTVNAGGELALAAASYALASVEGYKTEARGFWPWRKKSKAPNDMFKPKDKRRDLICAGALIIAEVERLDRAQIKSGK